METITQAKEYVKANWDKGVKCPCCERFVKKYTYSINSTYARLLIFMYKQYKKGIHEVHVEQALSDNHIRSQQVQSKLVLWGLIECIENENDPTKRKSGFYRIKPEGINFVLGVTRVPRTITYFNGEILERDSELVDIHYALQKKFNY